jgi:hypothetical protein
VGNRYVKCPGADCEPGYYREECRLLWCDVVWLLLEPTFRRIISPQSSGWKNHWAGRTLAVTSVGSNKSQTRQIPEDGILHSHCSENTKSYMALTGSSVVET